METQYILGVSGQIATFACMSRNKLVPRADELSLAERLGGTICFMSDYLRVLHVIPSLAAGDGGPSAALPLMARALSEAGIQVTVVATHDGSQKTAASAGGTDFIFFRRQTHFYKFSWSLTYWLWKHIGEFDLVHIHALFSYSSIMAAWLARLRGIPYVVRPLGVLDQWGRENRRPALKRLSLKWVELPILRRVAAMHYTSRREQAEAAEADPVIGTLPSVVIPLAVELPSMATSKGRNPFLHRFPMAAGRPLVLFLSRLDQKKGLDLLLPAFAEVRRLEPLALLVIAGDGEASFVGGLKTDAKALGLDNDVLWTGFLGGAEKAAAFASATVFVLPSYSENFGFAAAEALTAGIPTVLSDRVAIAAEVEAAQAGLVVPCEVSAIAHALNRLLADTGLRQQFGCRARSLADDRFSLATVGRALTLLYRSILDTR